MRSSVRSRFTRSEHEKPIKKGQNSRTAEAAAAFRASHFLYAQPWVFKDPYALALTSRGWRAVLSSRPSNWLVFSGALRKLKPLVAQVLGRSRFAEDALASAMDRGINQYVIVGAGLDSYALRCPDRTGQLRIFEVDHPDTQRAKRQRLGSLGITLPAHLEFVAIDFELQELSEAMKGSSHQRDTPAFYSWLGTTHYLTPQATLATLGSIARCAAPGSEVVLDYSVPRGLIDPDKLRDLLWVEKLARRMGEPLIGNLDPAQLHAAVAQLGYEIVEDLAAPEQALRYFSNRTDGLEPTPVSRLLHLRLP